MVKSLEHGKEVRKRLEAELINDCLGKGNSGAVYESKNILEESASMCRPLDLTEQAL